MPAARTMLAAARLACALSVPLRAPVGCRVMSSTPRRNPVEHLSIPSHQNFRNREPGINPNRFEAPKLNQRSLVQIADYSKERVELHERSSEDFGAFLAEPRPEWEKQNTVRWIHVSGLSWDEVLKPLAIKYELHPLALEDVLHHGATSATVSKVDYYPTQLFLSAVHHRLADQDDPPAEAQFEHEDVDTEPESSASSSVGGSSLLSSFSRSSTLLAGAPSVHIHTSQLSIFLLLSGTVLSIAPAGEHPACTRLFSRLKDAEGSLRASADPSMLVQALLDVVGDDAVSIAEAYRAQLAALEREVLFRPQMGTIRRLHVLSAELLLLKSTLSPLQSLLHSLRRRDDLKSAVVQSQPTPGEVASKPTRPFLSETSKLYMGDVADHLDSVNASLDLYSGLAENLVDYQFNMLNHASTKSMVGLSVLSAVFLPLTFLTGYFGMNLEGVANADFHLFWNIAIPVLSLSVLMFGRGYIAQMGGMARRLALGKKKRIRTVTPSR